MLKRPRAAAGAADGSDGSDNTMRIPDAICPSSICAVRSK